MRSFNAEIAESAESDHYKNKKMFFSLRFLRTLR